MGIKVQLGLDAKYITEPLTPEEMPKINAWKFDFLRRLRQEKVDESYINVYLEAWKLPRKKVFSNEVKP